MKIVISETIPVTIRILNIEMIFFGTVSFFYFLLQKLVINTIHAVIIAYDSKISDLLILLFYILHRILFQRWTWLCSIFSIVLYVVHTHYIRRVHTLVRNEKDCARLELSLIACPDGSHYLFRGGSIFLFQKNNDDDAFLSSSKYDSLIHSFYWSCLKCTKSMK